MSEKDIVPAQDSPLVQRDDKGRFVKGYSGNPAGKPKGVKHRATLIKETIDAAMADMLHDEFIEVMEKALAMAKKGDKAMIKLLLGDFLNEVRKRDGDGDGNKLSVDININDYTPRQEKVIQHEYRSIEGETVHTDE